MSNKRRRISCADLHETVAYTEKKQYWCPRRLEFDALTQSHNLTIPQSHNPTIPQSHNPTIPQSAASCSQHAMIIEP
jgi:hypothetical protein